MCSNPGTYQTNCTICPHISRNIPTYPQISPHIHKYPCISTNIPAYPQVPLHIHKYPHKTIRIPIISHVLLHIRDSLCSLCISLSVLVCVLFFGGETKASQRKGVCVCVWVFCSGYFIQDCSPVERNSFSTPLVFQGLVLLSSPHYLDDIHAVIQSIYVHMRVYVSSSYQFYQTRHKTLLIPISDPNRWCWNGTNPPPPPNRIAQLLQFSVQRM